MPKPIRVLFGFLLLFLVAGLLVTIPSYWMPGWLALLVVLLTLWAFVVCFLS